MSVTDKVWGTTEALVTTPLFEMHRLVIKPWHRCSMHRHRFKHNTFYVVSGGMFIDTDLEHLFVTGGGDIVRHMMWPGDVYTLLPGVAHQFRTQSDDCVALEMYFTEPLSEDIVRS